METCKRCKVELVPGKAIEQTCGGISDFQEIVTISNGGPGRLIDCLKCPICGYSISGPLQQSIEAR